MYLKVCEILSGAQNEFNFHLLKKIERVVDGVEITWNELILKCNIALEAIKKVAHLSFIAIDSFFSEFDKAFL
ncbi:hypothetical protein [Coxiella endosymbiont of Ornithodoros amblus]|uniref:hypothetical protein n=1 Tax=Coxiella endosymbiont of Ornithodoros amblus TaxID=1656166 RepID=UPI00244DAAB9|nr:hypothetical protein [Coxiella endosymbiont of Ornithodoros amblus]